MPHKIFVNLPVKDLDRSTAFFTALGYRFDENFTDENATCLVITDDIYAMLLTEPFFKGFTKNQIADTTTATEAILALSVDSRAAVDEIVDKALAAGGAVANEPNDQDFMYGRSFLDPDGHQWEIFWMDPTAAAS